MGAFDTEVQILSAEVKQRAFTEEEILLFAQRLKDAELQRGFILAFRQQGQALDQEQLTHQARRLYAVELSFFTKASVFLGEAVRYAPRDVRLSLARFPRDAVARMEQLEVSMQRIREWAALFDIASAD